MHRAVLAMIDSVCLTSDRLSVTRWYDAKMTPATIVWSSLEDSPMTSFLKPQNSKGNIGSEGTE